jgi:Undecaprenyl-phosphate glucose phosphotransferase
LPTGIVGGVNISSWSIMGLADRLTPQNPASASSRESWSYPAFHVADLSAASRCAAPEPPRPAEPGAERISQPMLVGALHLFDVLNFPTSGLLAYLSASRTASLDGVWLWTGLVTTTVIGLAVLEARYSYTIRAMGSFGRQAVSLALAFGLALALWSAAAIQAGFSEPELLRDWTALWFAGGCVTGCGARAVFAGAVALWTRQGRLARRTVVVGGGAHALETIQRLEKSGKGALQILGVFDDRHRARLPEDIGHYKLLGAFDDLDAFCRDEKVDLLIVAIPLSAEARLLQILGKLWVLPVDVRISALGTKLTLRDRVYHHIGEVPFLPVFDKAISDWGNARKAMFDAVAGLALTIALSPLLALIALGVKLTSPGPIIFRQVRYGFNNERFEVFKFRSMYVDLCDPTAEKQVTRHDPRVTPFGAFIRRTSLDELPQLFNVLRGDLSLVGPRPHAIKGKAAGRAYEQVVDGYFARHRVRPGITGWAQVNGWRGETDTIEKIEQRVAYDLQYIENWSVCLDLKILATTPVAVLFGKNAF